MNSNPSCQYCGALTHFKGTRILKTRPSYRRYRCSECRRITADPPTIKEPYNKIGDRPLTSTERARRWREKKARLKAK